MTHTRMSRIPQVAMLLACVLVPSLLRANMAPHPRTGPALDAIPLPGHSIQPLKLADQDALEVEMVSEQVDMTFERVKSTSLLTVSVTFMFKNHAANDADLPVIYPIGRRDTMTEFAVQHDGIKQKFKQKRKAADDSPNSRGKPTPEVWYYEWDCTFPADETMVIRIDYTLKLNAIGRTGYTVSTGGSWKGKIAKSVLTLTASPTDWGYVRSFGPLQGAQAAEGRVIWNYTDYDPGTEHDIWIEHNDETLDEACARLASNTDSWTNRVQICELRSRGFYAMGAVSHSKDTLRRYRQALAALIDEAEQKEDRLVLPATEKTPIYMETPTGRQLLRTMEGARTYIRSPGELFNCLPQVDYMVQELGDEPETVALVRSWYNLAQAFLDKKLYAGKGLLVAHTRSGLTAAGQDAQNWVATKKDWLAARE